MFLTLLCTVCSTPKPAQAQITTVLRSNTAMEAYQFRGLDGRVDRRSVDQRLQTRVAASDRLVAFVSARYRFDLGMPGDPAWALAAERQLEPTLESAWIDWRPLPGIALRAGRHDLFDAHVPARIDGASIEFQPLAGTTLAASAGVRADSALQPITDWSFEAPGTSPWRRDAGAGNLLSEVRLHHARRAFAAGVFFRDEQAIGHDVQYGRRLGGELRAGRADRANVTLLYRHHLLLGLPERAALHASLPLRRGWSADAGAGLERLLLPLDSPFIIYGTGAHADAWTGLARSGGALRISTAAFARVANPSDSALPWGRDARTLAGVRFSLQRTPTPTRRTQPSWGWDSRGEFTDSLDGTLRRATAGLGGTLGVYRGPDFHLRLQASAAWDRRAVVSRTAWGVFGFAGAQFRASTWANLLLSLQGGASDSGRWQLRSLITLDLRLPGGPR